MKTAFLAALLSVLLLNPGQASGANPEISAAGAALMEVRTGRVLYEKNGEERAYMASTTKVMTALLAIEQGDPAESVAVPDCAVGAEGSSMYLERGERMQLRDLLYGLMLTSGNDAAITIAEHIGGGVEPFANLMNDRAQQIGCRDTHFQNPNGLPDPLHYTTPSDLCRIAVEAMRNETFREIVGTSYYETATGDRPRTLKNKNKILWRYEGGNGVKTGYTKAAGKCLVFSAERAGMTLVGVVLNAPDMWGDAEKLLDLGFATVEQKLFVRADSQVGEVPAAGGIKKELAVSPKEDILYPIRIDGQDAHSIRVELPDRVTAPIQAGDVVGALTLTVNGEDVLTTPLIASESIRKKRFLDDWKEILLRFAA